MKRIIINADDFGINQEVTSEIERMVGLGSITSTTIMANGKCLDEVKRFAGLHPEISFGVHLCLSEFESITKTQVLKQYGLIDDKGFFVHKQIFKIEKFDDDLKTAIKYELNAQIEMVKSLGVPISHSDSHHHVHTIYALRDVFAEVLHDNGIKKVRIGGNFSTLRMKMHLFEWIKREKLNRFYKKKFITTNVFSSYSECIKSGCSIKTGNTAELMCHPGHPGKKYRAEMDLVEKRSFFFNKDVILITYNDL